MADALPIFDVVISLLPYSQASEKYFNRNFFEGMKPSAIFINVGRGKTVDEIALADALASHRIRKAAIDVTYVEPLEIQSPLWEIPGLIITPHISGGRPQGSERLIESNARRLRDKSDLLNIITR
jgi:phosphoglycerate dehydrogenase-like enzyme